MKTVFATVLVVLALGHAALAVDELDAIPIYKATLLPGGSSHSRSWPADCFQKNSGYLTADSSGGKVTFDISSPKGDFCSDMYLIATQRSFTVREFFSHGSHEVSFQWKDAEEWAEVQLNGVQVFTIKDHTIGFLEDLFKFAELFLITKKRTIDEELQFYKEFMNRTYETRPQVSTIMDEKDVKSGDFLAILQFGGPLGGLGNLITYGTGSATSHTAICLWINGTLYVAESTTPGIIYTPYKQWMDENVNSLYSVNLLRLKDQYRELFDEDKAAAFFFENKGLPYGYENFVYGWVDTETDNYPPPLTNQFLRIGLPLFDKLIPGQIDLIFASALNKRLGTEGLTIDQVYDVLVQRNLTLEEVMTWPEQDKWRYGSKSAGNYGRRMVCDVFVLETMRAAGIFGPLGEQFQITEFTPRDAYQLSLFNDSWVTPDVCKDGLGRPGYCQLTGKYILELWNWNQLPLYPNMLEKCGSEPPLYKRVPYHC